MPPSPLSCRPPSPGLDQVEICFKKNVNIASFFCRGTKVSARDLLSLSTPHHLPRLALCPQLGEEPEFLVRLPKLKFLYLFCVFKGKEKTKERAKLPLHCLHRCDIITVDLLQRSILQGSPGSPIALRRDSPGTPR